MRTLLLLAVLGVSVLHIESCSEPLGYETLSKEEVLKHQDLVVLGTFNKQDNTEEAVNGYKRYVLRLDTKVDCVLQNKNNITIGRNIKITEWRVGGYDEVPHCTDYFCCLRFGAEAIVSLAPHKDFPDEFEFREYNLQGHTYYTDIADLRSGEWQRWFGTPHKMSGGHCPSVVDTLSSDATSLTAKSWIIALLVLPMIHLLS